LFLLLVCLQAILCGVSWPDMLSCACFQEGRIPRIFVWMDIRSRWSAYCDGYTLYSFNILYRWSESHVFPGPVSIQSLQSVVAYPLREGRPFLAWCSFSHLRRSCRLRTISHVRCTQVRATPRYSLTSMHLASFLKTKTTVFHSSWLLLHAIPNHRDLFSPI